MMRSCGHESSLLEKRAHETTIDNHYHYLGWNKDTEILDLNIRNQMTGKTFEISAPSEQSIGDLKVRISQ